MKIEVSKLAYNLSTFLHKLVCVRVYELAWATQSAPKKGQTKYIIDSTNDWKSVPHYTLWLSICLVAEIVQFVMLAPKIKSQLINLRITFSQLLIKMIMLDSDHILELINTRLELVLFLSIKRRRFNYLFMGHFILQFQYQFLTAGDSMSKLGILRD